MLNTAILMGRITHTPGLKTTQVGKKYLKFTLAINRDKENVDFIDCLAWEKTAEFICNYFGKGSLIAVDGTIRTGTYTGKDGTNKKRFEVWVNRVSFTGEKKKEGEPAEIPVFSSDEDLPF
jgi:single-strand DNA-binding protein